MIGIETRSWLRPALGDPLAAGLSAWWTGRPAGGSAVVDAAGGNAFGLAGGATWTPSEVGPAATFDGSTGYAMTSRAVLNPNDGDWTAAVWLRLSSLGNTATNRQFLQQLDGTGTGRAWMSILSPSNVLLSNVGGSPTSGVTAITAGAWHLAAVANRGTTITLYLDGAAEASATVAVESNSASLYLWSSKTGTPSSLVGQVPEAALWRRALAAAEVAELYRRGPYGLAARPGRLALLAGRAAAAGGFKHWFRGQGRGSILGGGLC